MQITGNAKNVIEFQINYMLKDIPLTYMVSQINTQCDTDISTDEAHIFSSCYITDEQGDGEWKYYAYDTTQWFDVGAEQTIVPLVEIQNNYTWIFYHKLTLEAVPTTKNCLGYIFLFDIPVSELNIIRGNYTTVAEFVAIRDGGATTGEIALLTAQKIALENQIAQYNSDITTINGQLAQKQAEVTALGELLSTGGNAQEILNALSNLNNQIAQLNNQKTVIQSNVDTLNQELSTDTQELENVANEKLELEGNINTLTQEITSKNGELSSLQRQVQDELTKLQGLGLPISGVAKMKLTNSGRSMLARVENGEQLTITRFGTGSGVVMSEAQANELVALISEQNVVEITSKDVVTQTDLQLRGTLSSQSINTSYKVREIGIYAKIGNEAERLYCYANYGETGDIMPSKNDEMVVEQVLEFMLTVGSADRIDVTVISDNSYVTHPELNQAVNGLTQAISTEKAERQIADTVLSNSFTAYKNSEIALVGSYHSLTGVLSVQSSFETTPQTNRLYKIQMSQDATYGLDFKIKFNNTEYEVDNGIIDDSEYMRIGYHLFAFDGTKFININKQAYIKDLQTYTRLLNLESDVKVTDYSIGASGFYKLPKGLMFQWLTVYASGGETTHSFPKAFGVTCFICLKSPNSNTLSGGNDYAEDAIYPISNTQFRVRNDWGGHYVQVLAIGY